MDITYAYSGSMGIYEELVDGLRRYLDKGIYKNQAEIARAGGVQPMYVNRLLKGERSKNIQILSRFIENLGGKLVFPDESRQAPSHPIKINSRIIEGRELGEPADEDYLAVPLDEKRKAAAGEGIISEEFPSPEDISWVLVWTRHKSIGHRRNLAVIKIDMREGESMIPTLHPDDLVLIDRDEYKPQDPPGNIYLVQAPSGGELGLQVKRVKEQWTNGKKILVFYSDNPNKAPEVYDLQYSYDGDIRRAIKGRVVWSWSDMTKK